MFLESLSLEGGDTSQEDRNMDQPGMELEPTPELEETDNENSDKEDEWKQKRLDRKYFQWNRNYKYEAVLGYWMDTVRVQHQPYQVHNNRRKLCKKGCHKRERIIK